MADCCCYSNYISAISVCQLKKVSEEFLKVRFMVHTAVYNEIKDKERKKSVIF